MRTLLLRRTPPRHFTDDQRRILERLWNVNVARGRGTRLSIRAFARENAIPYPTLRRELLRGMAGGPLFDGIKKEWFYPEYSAERAGADAGDRNAQKGTGMRFTNKLAEGMDGPPRVSSVYCHIDRGDIGVLRGQTPYHPSGRRKRKTYLLKKSDRRGILHFKDWEVLFWDNQSFGKHSRKRPIESFNLPAAPYTATYLTPTGLVKPRLSKPSRLFNIIQSQFKKECVG